MEADRTADSHHVPSLFGPTKSSLPVLPRISEWWQAIASQSCASVQPDRAKGSLRTDFEVQTACSETNTIKHNTHHTLSPIIYQRISVI